MTKSKIDKLIKRVDDLFDLVQESQLVKLDKEEIYGKMEEIIIMTMENRTEIDELKKQVYFFADLIGGISEKLGVDPVQRNAKQDSLYA